MFLHMASRNNEFKLKSFHFRVPGTGTGGGGGANFFEREGRKVKDFSAIFNAFCILREGVIIEK